MIRFVDEIDAIVVVNDTVIVSPRLLLVPNLFAHDRCVGQKTKKCYLRETAEENVRVRTRGVIPPDGG